MPKITKQDLFNLLDTHLIVVDGEIYGKEQAINYLLKEIDRIQTDKEELEQWKKIKIYLN